MTTAELDTPCLIAGFDGTPSGFDAVALGRALAEAADARLIVVHVYPLTALGTTDVVLDSEIGERMREHAERTVDRARFVLDGFDAWEGRIYAAAPPARGLHEMAERMDALLIVVGSTHRHGLGRVMPGSTAERLLHGSGLPIAVAPAGWRGEALRAVGVGFDGSPESHAALRAARTLARRAGATLRAVSAFEPPPPAHPAFAVTSHGYTEITRELRADRHRRLEEALRSLPGGHEHDREVVDGHPADVLAGESHDLDLLVIGSRGYGALHATVAGSVAHRLATTSRCPLLIVPRGVERPLEGLAPRRRRAAR